MPNSVRHNEFSSLRRFGVELEIGDEIKKKTVQTAISNKSKYKVFCSKYALTSNNNYWHVKDDATCGRSGRLGPKGVEVASFIGSGVDDLNHVTEIASHLSSIGCKVNQNCGLHIHAEVVDLTTEQIAVIVAYWIKIEMLLSMILPLSRYQNEYCKFLFSPFLAVLYKNGAVNRGDKYDPMDFWQRIVPKNLSLFENTDRRFNLNLVNVARSIEINSSNRKTLELRWPEGSLNEEDIFGWVVLFISFIETCKDLKMPDDLYQCDLRQVFNFLGIGHKKNSFLILGAHLHRMKSWMCEKIVKNREDSSHFYAHFKTIGFQQVNVKEAKLVLEEMWSPVKNF